MSPALADPRDGALLRLLQALTARGYAFVTPTPETHARVIARPAPAHPTLRDIFGWSRAFRPEQLEPELLALLVEADALERRGDGLVRSGVRVSSLCGRLLVHSAYPTEAVDSVFFGPDSYRFADFIARELGGGRVGRLVDIGTGAGAGALAAAQAAAVAETVLTDINPAALRLAQINAAHAGLAVATALQDGLGGLGQFDVALANPPYIIDEAGRAYRHGGDLHGGRISVEMSEAALNALRPGGRLLLYTGAAVCAGENAVVDELGKLAAAHGATLRWRELDPDVFGEELSRPAYADVDRIAVIGAVLTK